MSPLSNDIYHHYLAHFDELPFDKQFHFASRIKLWSDEPLAADKLKGLRATFTSDEHPEIAIQEVFQRMLQNDITGTENALRLRQPYFAAYPQLRAVNAALFRATFMQNVYGIDAHHLVDPLVSAEELRGLAAKLLTDNRGLAVLSTYAVNMLYLSSRSFLLDEDLFDPELFIRQVAPEYDLDNLVHIQLYVYLYTHCIIGESIFYARCVPDRFLDTYKRMVADLETVISKRFDVINLDNKFEFLVASRLIGVESPLAARIEEEAGRSLASDGHFLIDTHNQHPQTAKSDLAMSEHRNVLYLLTQLPSRLVR